MKLLVLGFVMSARRGSGVFFGLALLVALEDTETLSFLGTKTKSVMMKVVVLKVVVEAFPFLLWTGG